MSAAPPCGLSPTRQVAALRAGLEPGDRFHEAAMFQIVEVRLLVAARREAA